MKRKEKIQELKYYKRLLTCIQTVYADYLKEPVYEKPKVLVKKPPKGSIYARYYNG